MRIHIGELSVCHGFFNQFIILKFIQDLLLGNELTIVDSVAKIYTDIRPLIKHMSIHTRDKKAYKMQPI